VMVIATTGPALVLAIGWFYFERVDGAFAIAAVLVVVCALVTLYATGMIYASLRTIRQWHQALTAPIYVTLGLASGAVLLRLLLVVLREASSWSAWLAMLLLGIGAALKWGYWLRIDGELRAYTLEAATGLGHLGEMGYQVARKHAQKLRKAALLFAFGLPILLLLISQAPGWAIAGAVLATLSLAAGLIIERWLFFAEAEHVSMLYYGEERL